MPRVKPIDVEDALRIDVKSLATSDEVTLSTCAPPVPGSLEESLPIAMFSRVGGGRQSIVIDQHDVSVDVWAGADGDFGSAMDAANETASLVCDLEGRIINGRHWLSAKILTMPYGNPDPKHPTIPRATFSARMTIRGE
jgi:hypothetical protein